MESTANDWWPSDLKLLELEYENSKLLVQQDGMIFQKWKTDFDLLINEEKSHRESQTYEKLRQTSTEKTRLLQDEVRTLEKELKESKEFLCKAKESLEDVKQNSKLEKENLKERLALEAQERLAKQQDKSKQERSRLNEEIEKWKNLKENLEEKMIENEKMLRLEADEKFKRQENEAENQIESLHKQLQTWKDKHAKAMQDAEDLQTELSNKTVVSKAKATQTQIKMVSKSIMACSESNTIGIQVEIPSDADSKSREDNSTKEKKTLSKKQNRTGKKAGHSYDDSELEKDSEPIGLACGSVKSDQQSDNQKNTSDKEKETNVAPSKAKQKRTRKNSAKSVESKEKKTSNDEDGATKAKGKGKKRAGLPGNTPKEDQKDVSSETRRRVPSEIYNDVPTEMNEGAPVGAEGVTTDGFTEIDQDVLTKDKVIVPNVTQEHQPTGAEEHQPTGAPESQPTVDKEPNKETSNKTVKKVNKRKCRKEPCKVDETDVKKAKSSTKTSSKDNLINSQLESEKSSKNFVVLVRDILENNKTKEKENRTLLSSSENMQKRQGQGLVNKDSSSNAYDKERTKQRKTSEQSNNENILKEKNALAMGTKAVAGNKTSQSRCPATRPSFNDRTRQSSIAEMSSILNGTKRQRTLYNTKDSSLMVSFLPVQESFINSTISRGNKPNGSMPPSLSAFMRSFVAPKLKKK